MTLEEIIAEWAEDVKIDHYECGKESLKIPLLHHKYYKEYMQTLPRLKKLELQMKKLRRVMYEYYNGELDEDECTNLGLEPRRAMLKGNIQMYIEADERVVKLQEMIIDLEMKAKTLEEITKSLATRSFNIKNMIEWSKFQQGEL